MGSPYKTLSVHDLGKLSSPLRDHSPLSSTTLLGQVPLLSTHGVSGLLLTCVHAEESGCHPQPGAVGDQDHVLCKHPSPITGALPCRCC